MNIDSLIVQSFEQNGKRICSVTWNTPTRRQTWHFDYGDSAGAEIVGKLASALGVKDVEENGLSLGHEAGGD